MPKGGLSENELSNLLFVYFAIASDIMELGVFEIFDKTEMCTVADGIVYAILVVWSVSMVQFAFPLSATGKRKLTNRRLIHKYCGWYFETEIWSLLLSVMVQDFPFFVIRLFCLVNYAMYSYDIIFFTVKNALVIGLQTYRIVVVLRRRQGEDSKLRKSTTNSRLLQSQTSDFDVSEA